MRADLASLLEGKDLSEDRAHALFTAIVGGDVRELELAALLVVLRMKGETAAEITGAARALRDAALTFERPTYAFADVVGTGGDNGNTINVSTAAAFVVAEAGLPVAKHGNRSVSSRCGAADLLERFGVRLDMSPRLARRCLDELGVTFLFAPHYHPGIRHAMSVRKALATRTVFNLLGPLVSPARPPIMLVGVYDPQRVRLVAESLSRLGCERALVVHGGGLDEIALHADTIACELSDFVVKERTLTAAQLGAPSFPLSAIVGGSPEQNEACLRAILGGRGEDAHVAAVAVNAAALLSLSQLVPSPADAYERACAILRSGAALHRLERFAAMSQGVD